MADRDLLTVEAWSRDALRAIRPGVTTDEQAAPFFDPAGGTVMVRGDETKRGGAGLICRLVFQRVDGDVPFGAGLRTHLSDLGPFDSVDDGFIVGEVGPLLAEALTQFSTRVPEAALLPVWATIPEALVSSFKRLLFPTALTRGRYIWHLTLAAAAAEVAGLRPVRIGGR